MTPRSGGSTTATVNGRLFVNNVSLGVYATVVQEESYRDAKLETTTNLLPELLGTQAEPFDLQFATPDGQQVDGAIAVLVSNNAYTVHGTAPTCSVATWIVASSGCSP